MRAFLYRWVLGVKPSIKIDLPKYGVVTCTQCHKYLRTGFVLRLMSHLNTDHKMDENLAIDTATHMLDLLSKAKHGPK